LTSARPSAMLVLWLLSSPLSIRRTYVLLSGRLCVQDIGARTAGNVRRVEAERPSMYITSHMTGLAENRLQTLPAYASRVTEQFIKLIEEIGL